MCRRGLHQTASVRASPTRAELVGVEPAGGTGRRACSGSGARPWPRASCRRVGQVRGAVDLGRPPTPGADPSTRTAESVGRCTTGHRCRGHNASRCSAAPRASSGPRTGPRFGLGIREAPSLAGARAGEPSAPATRVAQIWTSRDEPSGEGRRRPEVRRRASEAIGLSRRQTTRQRRGNPKTTVRLDSGTQGHRRRPCPKSCGGPEEQRLVHERARPQLLIPYPRRARPVTIWSAPCRRRDDAVRRHPCSDP